MSISSLIEPEQPDESETWPSAPIASAEAAQEMAKEEQEVENPTPGDNATTQTSEVSEEDKKSTGPSVPASEVLTEDTPAPSVDNTVAKNPYDEITDLLFARMAPVGSKANLKILIYGDPGTAKSSLLGTAEGNLIYDQEDGLISIKSSPNGMAPGIQAIPFTSFEQGELLVERLRDRVDAVKSFKVFSIDTMNDFSKKSLAQITEREWKKRPSRNRYVPETEDHQENNEKILRFVRNLRDLDWDIILTAHAKTVEPKNKPAKTYPDFSESLANKIEAMMDIVGYMEMRVIDGKATPVMRIVPDQGIHAKNRLGLTTEIINPTYPKIRELWETNRSN